VGQVFRDTILQRFTRMQLVVVFFSSLAGTLYLGIDAFTIILVISLMTVLLIPVILVTMAISDFLLGPESQTEVTWRQVIRTSLRLSISGSMIYMISKRTQR
jgi:hypothetical protein